MHPNGRGIGGRYSDLASPFHHKETPKIPRVLQLLPTVYSKNSTITCPLTSLLRNKPKSLSWTPAIKEAFETLKDAFTHAPVLVHPDPRKPFIVEVDASTTGVGSILSQQQGTPVQFHPCAFFSRKLSPEERNYDIGNRELLAIKLALEEWRHWLEGSQHPFIVLTDHKNLQYLREAKRLNPHHARWALYFTRFNYTISYCPGPNNTLSLLKNHYWSPNMARDVRRFVQGCTDCAIFKSPHHLPTGKLLPLPIPNRPWSHLWGGFHH